MSVPSRRHRLYYHKILEHVAAITQLRHIASPVVCHFADDGKVGNVSESHRYAQFRRGGADTPRRQQQDISVMFPVMEVNLVNGGYHIIFFIIRVTVIENRIHLNHHIYRPTDGRTHGRVCDIKENIFPFYF